MRERDRERESSQLQNSFLFNLFVSGHKRAMAVILHEDFHFKMIYCSVVCFALGSESYTCAIDNWSGGLSSYYIGFEGFQSIPDISFSR